MAQAALPMRCVLTETGNADYGIPTGGKQLCVHSREMSEADTRVTTYASSYLPVCGLCGPLS